jgi:hypothetical protein
MTKKALGLLAAVAVLAGCNSFKAETYSDNMVMPLTEGSTDSLRIDIGLEYVVKGLSEEVMAKINAAILTVAFDLEEKPGSVEETAIRYRDNLVDEYIAQHQEASVPAGFATWEDNIYGQFSGRYKDWLNYQMAYYSYRGGIHGVQTVTGLVFDTATGATLTEQDLFAPGYEAPLKALLYQRIQEGLDPDDASMVEEDWLKVNGNFCVGPEGVQWFFQPYEIGPYVLGLQTATLSWKELEPYRK